MSHPSWVAQRRRTARYSETHRIVMHICVCMCKVFAVLWQSTAVFPSIVVVFGIDWLSIGNRSRWWLIIMLRLTNRIYIADTVAHVDEMRRDARARARTQKMAKVQNRTTHIYDLIEFMLNNIFAYRIFQFIHIRLLYGLHVPLPLPFFSHLKSYLRFNIKQMCTLRTTGAKQRHHHTYMQYYNQIQSHRNNNYRNM